MQEEKLKNLKKEYKMNLEKYNIIKNKFISSYRDKILGLRDYYESRTCNISIEEFNTLNKKYRDYIIEMINELGCIFKNFYNIDFCITLSGSLARNSNNLYSDIDINYVNEVCSSFNLNLSNKVKKYSLGTKQKLGLILALINKGDQSDILAMTATPIPRTLASTVYGDMTVSEIHHMPAGRKPIISSWKTSSQMKDVYQKMQEQLAQGFQIYAVTPLITESETLNLKNAEELHAKLSHDFPNQNVVLLHGQMPGPKKDEIMTAFASGKINILVTTSVIEVGVDVANANMMVIYNADRFGLSQLHQLRGRIGRGKTQSYCVFIADPKTASGKATLKIIAATNDGFKLAEEDLKMRGEGDLFGKAQSGLPEFRVGDVVNNYNTLVVAQKVARELVQQDPKLADHQTLNQVLEYKQLEQNRI